MRWKFWKRGSVAAVFSSPERVGAFLSPGRHVHPLPGELPHEVDARLLNGEHCTDPDCLMTKAGY